MLTCVCHKHNLQFCVSIGTIMQRDLIEVHPSAAASASASASASAAALSARESASAAASAATSSAGGGDDASEHVCHGPQRPELGHAHLGAA